MYSIPRQHLRFGAEEKAGKAGKAGIVENSLRHGEAIGHRSWQASQKLLYASFPWCRLFRAFVTKDNTPCN